MRLNKISLAALLLGSSAFLAACGGSGGGSSATPTANGDLTASIKADKVPVMLNKNFSFESGVASLGTQSPTTIVLSGAAATPTFTLKSGTNSATGEMTYGSCIFEIKNSTFPASFTKLQVGVKTEVTPCDLKVATAGFASGSHTSFIKWVLGTASSVSIGGITIAISSSGVVTISGIPFGTITFTVNPVTGATGGTGGTGTGGTGGAGTF